MKTTGILMEVCIMKRSNVTGLLACVIVFVSGMMAFGQGKNPKPPKPRDDVDYGHLERPIGLLLDTGDAWPGYTLFAPKHYTRTYLMDNQGGIVNSWDSPYEPGQSVYLLPDGHLLHASFIKGGGGGTGGGEGGRIEEYDWEGNLVWEFDYHDRDYGTHHDIEPLPNGNILALA